MTNQVIQNIKFTVYRALHDLAVNGQNGALSAGKSSFNSLCDSIALRTGKPFDMVVQVTAPIWEEFWEFRIMQGLETWPDNWHDWEF
jgi:DNA-binding transcriptional regulator PaaX